MASKVYTVLVNWRGAADTIVCLDSLVQVEDQPQSIIICDNASPDDSVARICDWATGRFGPPCRAHQKSSSEEIWEWSLRLDGRQSTGKLSLVVLRENGGFSTGNNAGIKLALLDPLCEFVFLLNNDTTVMKDCLTRLVHKMRDQSNIAVCGCTLVYDDKPSIVQGLGGTYSLFLSSASAIGKASHLDRLPTEADVERQMDYVIGAAMFIRRSFLDRIKLLSPKYFLFYEELDLASRLLPNERLGWASDVVVRHKVGSSIGTDRGKSRSSDLCIYCDQRSRVNYYFDRRPGYIPFLLLSLVRTLVAYAVKKDWTAVRLVMLAYIDAVVRGPYFRRAI